MGYSLHIERKDPIELSEWRDAVEATSAVRLDESSTSATNTGTGEIISMPAQAGSASVNVGGTWSPVFRWRKGKVSFNAPSNTTKADPVMAAALDLARALAASVCGDEGEAYDGSL
jgi:hypothetical protein